MAERWARAATRAEPLPTVSNRFFSTLPGGVARFRVLEISLHMLLTYAICG
jgi:hypothetical protein